MNILLKLLAAFTFYTFVIWFIKGDINFNEWDELQRGLYLFVGGPVSTLIVLTFSFVTEGEDNEYC